MMNITVVLFLLGAGAYFAVGSIAVGIFLAIKKKRAEELLYKLGVFLWSLLGKIVAWSFVVLVILSISIELSVTPNPSSPLLPSPIISTGIKGGVLLFGVTLLSILFLMGFNPEFRRGE